MSSPAFRAVILILVVHATASAEPAQDSDSRYSIASESIDAAAAELTGPGQPGLAVMVIEKGRVVHAKAYGVRDLDSKEPVTLDTPFYVASVTKPITAMAVLMLVERNEMSLDDTLRKYFPEFPAYAEDVTIRQMLSHTSGLIDYFELFESEEQVDGMANSDVLNLLLKRRQYEHKPGERWGYSNSAYVLLAMIIEKVSGMSFSEFIDKNIFDPLGMNNSIVFDDKRPEVPDRARGYVRDGETFKLSDYNQTTTGAGGIFSSVNDLHKFAMALDSERILPQRVLQVAFTPVTLPNGRPTPFGLGWQSERWDRGPLKGVSYICAFGSLKGFRSVLWKARNRDLTIIMLSACGKMPYRGTAELYLTSGGGD